MKRGADSCRWVERGTDDGLHPLPGRPGLARLPGRPHVGRCRLCGRQHHRLEQLRGRADWPFPTYPEFLQRLCEPSGLIVANCGIAGEVSPNGIGQVRDYLDLFPNARYFVVGYGTNDLGMWPQVERTSPRIIENLDRMVRAIRDGRQETDPPERALCERVPVPPPGRRGPPPQAGLSQRPAGGVLRRATVSRWSISARSSGMSTSPTSCIRTRRGRRSSPRRSSGCWPRCGEGSRTSRHGGTDRGRVQTPREGF